jgi:hypothetical protein
MLNINYKTLIGGLGMAVVLAGSAGCATRHDERSAGRIQDDEKITSSVKDGLEHEHVYKFENVKVDTFAGAVQLSGFVNSEEQKRRAQEVAERTDGVTEVINSLAIKQFSPTPTGRAVGTKPPRVYAEPPIQPPQEGIQPNQNPEPK